MINKQKVIDLRERMRNNLVTYILPFWSENLKDEENGGFYGRIDGEGKPDATYPKGEVLNARILWTFSKAYQVIGDEKYAELAKRAYEYLRDYFWDKELGGAYWAVSYKGLPVEVEKRTYGQAFYIYSMAEYFRVFRDKRALELAMRNYALMDEHVRRDGGGYMDSVNRDWSDDIWVWRWFMNPSGAPKLLNSHLHFFEATINLLQVTGDKHIQNRLREFLLFLMDTGFDRDLGHLKAAMNERGERTDNEISYGHDAECSYLISYAAELLDDEELKKRANDLAVTLTKSACEEALDYENGGMNHEKNAITGTLNKTKVWWTQCEGVTGFFNAYELTEDEKYLDAALHVWDFCENNLTDKKYGDWLPRGKNKYMDESIELTDAADRMMMGDDKANKMKCPYHNSRTCFEIMARADRLLEK